MQLWSEEAFRSSASEPLQHLRRFSFDVPLPAQVVDPKVAQRKEKDKDAVVFAQPVPLLAGRAVVIAWYDALSEALERATSGAGQEGVRDFEQRVFKLFEAALSVPIRLRLNPDSDNCRLLSLRFSEQAYSVCGATGADSFWKFAQKVGGLGAFRKTMSLSIPKAMAELKQQGLLFKGKVLTEQSVKALRALTPYVEDAACPHCFCAWRNSVPLAALACRTLMAWRHPPLPVHLRSVWIACASVGWRATSRKRTLTPFRA